MALSDFVANLEKLRADAENAFADAARTKQLVSEMEQFATRVLRESAPLQQMVEQVQREHSEMLRMTSDSLVVSQAKAAQRMIEEAERAQSEMVRIASDSLNISYEKEALRMIEQAQRKHSEMLQMASGSLERARQLKEMQRIAGQAQREYADMLSLASTSQKIPHDLQEMQRTVEQAQAEYANLLRLASESVKLPEEREIERIIEQAQSEHNNLLRLTSESLNQSHEKEIEQIVEQAKHDHTEMLRMASELHNDSHVQEIQQIVAQAQRAYERTTEVQRFYADVLRQEQLHATAALEAARVEFLGAKSGQLKSVQKGLGSVAPADKPAAGKLFNEVKTSIEAALAAAQEQIASGAASSGSIEPFDRTLPGPRPRLGHLHPLSQTIDELKDIMGRLGFTVATGPEIEDEWHNFEALNIPASHPARDSLENFYLSTAAVSTGAPLLLRSQTSTVQIRVMEKTPPPVRVISLGRVYRPDTADATHYPMFHQIEGLLVDKGVTMADLKSVLRLFAASFLGGDVHIRFRPSFFPFTEPSVEVDMSWHDAKAGGAIRWIEMGGAGMVDPNVLAAVGYDPEQVTGFAFGIGVERVCARRHGVSDIREFYKNDVRFLHQF